MDKPVCSKDGMSLLSYVKSREGDVWKVSDTLAVEAKLRDIVEQMGVIRKAAQEALQLHD